MLDVFWVIRSHGQYFRVDEQVKNQLLAFIEAVKKQPVRDTTALPVFFTFQDTTGGTVILDIKAIAGIHESSHDIRALDRKQANFLNVLEFPSFD